MLVDGGGYRHRHPAAGARQARPALRAGAEPAHPQPQGLRPRPRHLALAGRAARRRDATSSRRRASGTTVTRLLPRPRRRTVPPSSRPELRLTSRHVDASRSGTPSDALPAPARASAPEPPQAAPRSCLERCDPVALVADARILAARRRRSPPSAASAPPAPAPGRKPFGSATRSICRSALCKAAESDEPLALRRRDRALRPRRARSVSSVVSPGDAAEPGKHQELRGELAVHQPAARELHVEGTRRRLLALDPRRASTATSAASFVAVARLCDERVEHAGHARISSASPAIGAAARHRHVLPGPRLVQLIVLEGLDMRRERPGPAGRPQPQVDRVGDPLRGRRGERRDQPLRQPRVVLRRRQRPRAVRGGGIRRRGRR